MKRFWFLILLSVHFVSKAQPSFIKAIQVSSYTEGSMCRLADGNYALLYVCRQFNHHASGVFMMDQNFTLAFHAFLDSSNEQAWKIYPTLDSGFFALGNYIKKVDKYGNQQFAGLISEPAGSVSIFLDGVQTMDKGFLLTGIVQDSGGYYKFDIIKLDSIGNVSWIKSSPNTVFGWASILSANEDSSITVHTNDYYESYITKFDLAGNILLSKRLTLGGNPLFLFDIKPLPDNGYIVPYNGSLMKTDSVVNAQWRKSYTYNGTSLTWLIVRPSKDGSGYLVATYYQVGNWSKPILFKTNLNGQPVWARIFENVRNIRTVCEADNNDILVVADSIGGDMQVIKLDSLGSACTTYPVTVVATSEQLPSAVNAGSYYVSIQGSATPVFFLPSTLTPTVYDYCATMSVNPKFVESTFQLSPNPSTGKINIRKETPEDATLRVFNLSGEEVFETDFSASFIEQDLSFLKSGFYFVIIESEQHFFQQKLVIM